MKYRVRLTMRDGAVRWLWQKPEGTCQIEAHSGQWAEGPAKDLAASRLATPGVMGVELVKVTD